MELLSSAPPKSRVMKAKKKPREVFDDDSTASGVAVGDFVDDEDYRDRVTDMVVVDQMLAAHTINKQASERRRKKKETFADRVKNNHAMQGYNGHNESMKRERENFHSLALLCETRLRETVAHTSMLEELPDEYRTAVVCDIMMKLTPVFGRYVRERSE